MKSRFNKAKTVEQQVKGDPVALLKDTHQKLKQAETLRLNQKLDAAEKICAKLVKDFPQYYGALHTLGLILSEKQDHAAAIFYLTQAAMLNQRSWTTLTALAGEYLSLGAREMAGRTLRDALDITSSQPEIYVTLAEVYYEEREYLLSAEAAEKALDLEPDMESAMRSLLNSYGALGRFVEQRTILDRLFELFPPTVGLVNRMASLPAALINRDLIAELDRAETGPNITPADAQIQEAFVRAVAYDKAERYQDAWEWAVKANNLVPASIAEEMAQELASVEQRANWFAKNLSRYQNKTNIDPDYPTSLYILGLSRSGKTTTESIIASQLDVCRGYENPAMPRAIISAYQEGSLVTFNSIAQLPLQLYPLVKKFYKENIDKIIGGNKIFTNTTPGHIWDSPILTQVIPNAKFVFVKRNFYDLILRIYMKNYKSGNFYSYNLEVLQNYIRQYEKMIDFMKEAFPKNSIIINYEDMVRDPGKTLDQICELCDLVPDHSLLSIVPSDVGCSEPYRELIDAALDKQ